MREEMWTYDLSDGEVELAYERACAIVGMDVARGWKMYFEPGTGESRLEVNIRGFAAEIAASRLTGLPLNEGVLSAMYRRRDKPADIGRRVEVRSAMSPRSPLYVYRTDPRGRLALLMTGAGYGPFTARGWLPTDAAKVPRYWSEPPAVRFAAYAVPQSDLRAMPLPEGER